ncbi:MAG: hypothetical protein M3457_22580 [Chloroflexota bacterium]|nr:hypothetical protein [Chloroflexota bacterium]
MTTDQRWYQVADTDGAVFHIRGSDYEDAAQQLVHSRRKEGQYRDVPEYDACLMLIGGPLNPIRVEVFEYSNLANGTALDSFRVVLDDDVIAEKRRANEELMRAHQPPYWMRSRRHG